MEFICANTDAQALKRNRPRRQLQLGTDVTKGLGAGANPEIGRQAAIEDRERIVELIEGADMLFLTAGMGGGTGTGAAPIVAEVARELGILTVAVVTKPFAFEGKRQQDRAGGPRRAVARHVDSLIVIPERQADAGARRGRHRCSTRSRRPTTCCTARWPASPRSSSARA